MSNNDRPDLVVRPNKTRLKQEIAELQHLIDQMTKMTDKELRRIKLDEDVIEEVARVRAIKPSSARNRQLKYCAKQLTGVDLSVAETYLNDRHSQQLEINQKFHKLERWRDKLIEMGDAAMGEALTEWPDMDRQHLRQLVRDAQREVDKGKPVGAQKKLFKLLRDSTPDEDA